MMKLIRWALPLAVLVLILAAGMAVYQGLSQWFHREPATTVAVPGDAPIVFKAPEGGLLEVATLRSPSETFERTDPLTFWGIDLGSTVSRVSVAAVFRYHVPLAPRGWHIKRIDGQFHVIVPAVRPSLPVAIDTSTLRKYTEAGWLRFNASDNLAALEQSLTAELGKRATTPSYIEQQRAKARETVREFVTDWLIKQERWKDVKPSQVRVFFADEPIESMGSAAANFVSQQ